MLNHGNNNNNNIPKTKFEKNLAKIFFFIHQEIKWKNNLKIFLEVFSIVAS